MIRTELWGAQYAIIYLGTSSALVARVLGGEFGDVKQLSGSWVALSRSNSNSPKKPALTRPHSQPTNNKIP